MQPDSNQPYPQQPTPDQSSGPQPMQNGQSIPLQSEHRPYEPGRSDWQQGLGQPFTQSPPSPYQPAQYQPSTPVRLPGRPSDPVYSAEQPVPPVRPASPVWQQPSAAPGPNEISMPGPGASEYRQPTPAPAPAPVNNYNQLATENVRHNRRPLVIIVVVLVVLLLAAAAYFSFVRKDAANGVNNTDELQTTQTEQISKLADVQTATLIPPQAIDGYTERKTGTASIRNFIATDGKCELLIGTVSTGQLPGKTTDDIIRSQIDQLRNRGSTVEGPSAGEALKLKDAKESSKAYTLDTVGFKSTQGNTQTLTHYSVVILKSGDRAVVNRTCHNEGSVDENSLKKLDAAATQITVQTTKQ